MARIHLKVATGDEFTISNAFYGADGPLTDRRSAEIQTSFILTNSRRLGQIRA